MITPNFNLGKPEQLRALHGRMISVENQPDWDYTKRDQALAEYRQLFINRLRADVQHNYHSLITELSNNAPRDRWLEHQRHELTTLFNSLITLDPWSDSAAELACWNQLHQFYLDGLFTAHRLRRLQAGEIRPDRCAGSIRRTLFPGAGSPKFLQALLNQAEQGLPNFGSIRSYAALLPLMLYQTWHGWFGWPGYRFQGFLDRSHLLLRRGVLNQISGRIGPAVIVQHRERLFEAGLIDPATRRSRHNIILAASHRHGLLDAPVTAEALRGLEIGTWVAEQFFPKFAHTDPNIVGVHAGESHLKAMLADSARIMIDRQLPLLMFVDGGTPFLFYGQQMRVKRGLRVLTRYLERAGRGSSRKTYIVPITFNDNVTYIRGLDPHITATFHPPIDIADIPPAPPANPDLPNDGDPLLNYLECFYLGHTGQLRHGWHTPDILQTIIRNEKTEMQRTWVRDYFHRSIYALAKV
ncbi:MAG: hypothetical protein HJJLKODD_00202 [Phycisphaerae bacterium]|nr:hypothetical protein [Phycisphaerae bacterium]